MLITFSGLDGSGKSTLIAELKKGLEKRNFGTAVLTMYDHVGLYAMLRYARNRIIDVIGRKRKDVLCNDPDRIGMKAGDYGSVISAGIGVLRSRLVKRLVYFIDLCLFLLYRLYFEKIKKRVLILDRYFYDSLADVTDGQKWSFVRLFLFIVPTPDAPIFVDVSPEDAFSRKGEYPVDYMIKRRGKYKKIFSWVNRPIILANDNLEKTIKEMEAIVCERMTLS